VTIKPEHALLALVVLYFVSKSSNGSAAHSPFAAAPAPPGVKHDANRTPLTAEQARELLEQTFRNFIMREPTPLELAMLLAHSALETGRWKKMLGNNWGFVTTDGGLDWFEVEGNPLKFRWYATPEQGCEDWLRQLMNNWSDAWGAIDSDNPTTYEQGLEHGRFGSYFGDPVTVGPGYLKGLTGLYNEFKNWTTIPPTRIAKRAGRARLAPARRRA
jgi:hypothetical protein